MCPHGEVGRSRQRCLEMVPIARRGGFSSLQRDLRSRLSATGRNLPGFAVRELRVGVWCCNRSPKPRAALKHEPGWKAGPRSETRLASGRSTFLKALHHGPRTSCAAKDSSRTTMPGLPWPSVSAVGSLAGGQIPAHQNLLRRVPPERIAAVACPLLGSPCLRVRGQGVCETRGTSGLQIGNGRTARLRIAGFIGEIL